MRNGIGIVKLMGRYAGFIAYYASMGCNNVDFCLIPELPFELEGPNGLYENVYKRVKSLGHCVIVVAEGAEEGLINPQEQITKIVKKDASGNRMFDDIGEFMKNALSTYAKNKYGEEFSVTYIDPTYAIRSVPANSGDVLLCSQLAQNAVHGVMYGFTGFSIGSIRNSLCLIPLTTMIMAASNRVQVRSRKWLRLVAVNDQPNFVNDEFKEAAEKRIHDQQAEIKEKFAIIHTRIERKQ